VCAKIVPNDLNDDKNPRRNEVSAEILEILDTEPDFFNGVVTCGGSRFFEYNPETEKQSGEWRTPRQKEVRMNK
jgi:hypothetical protein